MSKKIRILIAVLVLILSFTLVSCGSENEHEHQWGWRWTATLAPTCTDYGEEMRVCLYDESHTEVRPMEALGHDFSIYEQADSVVYDSDEPQIVAKNLCSRCAEFSPIWVFPKNVTTISNLEVLTLNIANESILDEQVKGIVIASDIAVIEKDAFLGWTSNITIWIIGFSNQAEADAVWGTDWRNGCGANIIYLG